MTSDEGACACKLLTCARLLGRVTSSRVIISAIATVRSGDLYLSMILDQSTRTSRRRTIIPRPLCGAGRVTVCGLRQSARDRTPADADAVEAVEVGNGSGRQGKTDV